MSDPAKKHLKDFSLPEGWSLETSENKAPVLRTKEGLNFSLDFSNDKKLSRKQPLFKAIGCKAHQLNILDITAGWAKDAVLMSCLNCHVTAVESNPFVFYFVQESLSCQKAWPSNLKFVLDNSLNYLNNLKESHLPDVIFMDPMFGDRKKSLSRKPLRVLKGIVGETKDQKLLFDLALKKAKKHVVVKRHRLEPPMKEGALSSFQGRSVCYDVFRTERKQVL